jgi:hypothetical protein
VEPQEPDHLFIRFETLQARGRNRRADVHPDRVARAPAPEEFPRQEDRPEDRMDPPRDLE